MNDVESIEVVILGNRLVGVTDCALRKVVYRVSQGLQPFFHTSNARNATNSGREANGWCLRSR